MKKNKFSGVLFDLDGTLLDTAPDFEFCLNQLLREENQPSVSSKAVRIASNYGLLGILTLGFGETLKNYPYTELENRLSDYYAQHLGQYSVLFPGIESCLNHLNKHEIPWGIVTNKLKRFTIPLVEKIAIFDKAQAVVSGDTLTVSKPDPAPLQYACTKMNLNPHETVYIGDAQRDMQAAIAADMPCVVATYGYLSATDRPDTWGADYISHDAHEFFTIITC